MAEPLEALRLLDFIDQNPPQKPYKRFESALRNPNSLLFEDLLDSSVDSIPGLSPLKNSPASNELNEEEEEELEWLSNKDAFPSLETSFEVETNASPVSVLPPSFKVPVKARSKIRQKRRRMFPPIRSAAPIQAGE
ncbi:uncharacterized protein A4U43_C04F2640 [Asparagus officinalis]|uniref:Uncharacterized protein n=1 Tax=Asparagus officinalis TaxID=4686 RepID=A0A5P1EXT9_ASPOF|nr:uncharacterized protein A4U43_C04F2640 [Asparagus officinalis]